MAAVWGSGLPPLPAFPDRWRLPGFPVPGGPGPMPAPGVADPAPGTAVPAPGALSVPGIGVTGPEAAGAGLAPGAGAAAGQVGTGLSFGQMLAQALDRLEADQRAAQAAARSVAAGQVQDLAQVILTSEEASIRLALAVQVRNKLLEAWQELSRMPL